MIRTVYRVPLSIALLLFVALIAPEIASAAAAETCIECHQEATPFIVKEWQLSKHSGRNITCVQCHGDDHISADDAELAEIPTYETCQFCHMNRVDQFLEGKHAKAWDSMIAMPTAHWQPMEMMQGMKGCGGCHKIGIKPEETIAELKELDQEYGLASCDACHTRHQFSTREARDPQACRTCHMGIDHPQWEMYSASKHGVRHALKQQGTLPEETAAPTCQFCHMPGGDHDVGTAWGFLAVRLPMPEDEEWAADRATILKALGVLDPQGNPTARLEVVKDLDMVRLTEEAWEGEREKMLDICSQCHSTGFARGELTKSDDMIREADAIMAEAIEIVADLYQQIVIYKPEYYGYAYPDVLTFHDAPTSIELKLYRMFHVYRMRTFQGSFHANPDYAFWYGWSEMRRSLTEIRELAASMLKDAKG